MHMLNTTALKVVFEKNCELLTVDAAIKTIQRNNKLKMLPEAPEPKILFLRFRGETRCLLELLFNFYIPLARQRSQVMNTDLFTLFLLRAIELVQSL